MNFVQFAFVVTVSLLCHVNCENTNLAKFDERAIINGYNAQDRPFYVKLNFAKTAADVVENNYAVCGGTIIGTQYVLTAAHCFMECLSDSCVTYHWDRIDVLVGDMSHPNYQNTVTNYTVIDHTIHPGYTGYTQQGYDLAIVKLSGHVSKERILQLCTDEIYGHGYPIALCGFGETAPENIHSDPPQLREAQIQDTNADMSCGYDYIFNKEIQICMRSIPGRQYSGPCEGDSGGPAFPLNNDDNSNQPICLYATVSFGATPYQTCDGDTVFNRVSYFRDWILGEIWNH